MEIIAQAKMLSAESKPYSFGGNEGVSHRIRLSIDGEIFVCKSDEKQIKEVQDYVGKDIGCILKLLSRKETLSLQLVQVKEV